MRCVRYCFVLAVERAAPPVSAPSRGRSAAAHGPAPHTSVDEARTVGRPVTDVPDLLEFSLASPLADDEPPVDPPRVDPAWTDMFCPVREGSPWP